MIIALVTCYIVAINYGVLFFAVYIYLPTLAFYTLFIVTIMPTKSKKAVFRGMPSWKMKKEEVVDEISFDANNSNSTLCQSEELSYPTTHISDAPISKCETRLQGSFLDDKIPPFSPSEVTQGYRLIDLECLFEACCMSTNVQLVI